MSAAEPIPSLLPNTKPH